MSLLGGIVSVVYADDKLTLLEMLGRRIYRTGGDGSNNEITASLGLNDDAVSASMFVCANCHGLEGEGKKEGGLLVPAISAQHLFNNPQANTRTKNAYDQSTLIRAITKGISSQDKPLGGAMPRYDLSNDQADALVAYLKQLGSENDVDSGITPSEVQLGTLLPLTGIQADTGRLLKSTLDACIAELNTDGLIYGRKVTLTTLDSGSTEEEGIASAKRLSSETKPFALISGYFPEASPELYGLFSQENMPIIAPLTFVLGESLAELPSFFYFLPSYIDQSLALVDYWLDSRPQTKTNPKVAIVFSHKASHLAIVNAIRQKLQHFDIVAEISMSEPKEKAFIHQISRLKTAEPDAIFFLGDAQALIEFNSLMPKIKHKPILLGLLAMLGAEGMAIPDLAMDKMLLASPFNLNDPGLRQFADILGRYSVSLQSPGLQRVVCAAVNFVAEGLKRSGKRLSRDKFIHALGEIKTFPMDIMPPLQFDANKRNTPKGAYVLTVDTHSHTVSHSGFKIPDDSIYIE